MSRVAWLFGCFFVCSSIAQGQTPYVVLVSFDGFRYDYISRFDAPAFKAFAAKGIQAEGLIPSFPSKTFPNHYTLVTGLYPGHHGLVDNSFYDTTRHQFYGMSNSDRVRDPYFYSGISLWQLAKQHHVRSASFFWVGSELTDPGLQPDYYLTYNKKVPDSTRVEQVLTWLQLPEDQRPHLITVYFSSPDDEGHLYGPSGDETRAAVANADGLLDMLVKGLQKIDLPVNVVLVSDHGMRELKHLPETDIFLDEIMPAKPGSIKISNGGTQAHIYTRNAHTRDSLYAVLKTKAKAHHFQVFKQKDFPKAWHYQNARSGDLLLTADDGYYIRDVSRKEFFEKVKEGSTFGVHGYDPATVKDMRGIFLAQGPNVRSGMSIPAFQNIHVYPFIATLLKLPIPEGIDGKISVLEKIYKK